MLTVKNYYYADHPDAGYDVAYVMESPSGMVVARHSGPTAMSSAEITAGALNRILTAQGAEPGATGSSEGGTLEEVWFAVETLARAVRELAQSAVELHASSQNDLSRAIPQISAVRDAAATVARHAAQFADDGTDVPDSTMTNGG